MKNNARISYSERKQLGRSQNIKHAKVFIAIVKNYLNVEFIEVPLITNQDLEIIFLEEKTGYIFNLILSNSCR